jgi:CRP-like cAMP-binding protein
VRLRKDAKIELLRRAWLFDQCSKRELSEISGLADEVALRSGRPLIREGTRGREFFVLIDGEVEVTRKGRRIDTMGAGEFFGEMALISNAPRNASVTSTTPVRALVITDRAFRALLERSPKIQLKVLQAVAERIPSPTL